jgi:hypothetical protein
MTYDLRVQDVRAVAAFRGIGVNLFAARQVVILAHILRQAAVDQFIGSTAQFLAPQPVFDLVSENFVQAAPGNIVQPWLHVSYIGKFTK